MKVVDLFSCIGCHKTGLDRVGVFETVVFVEANAWRRRRLAIEHPGVPIHDDVRTYQGEPGAADIVFGGPPCQATSVAAAIHGRRNGESLWPQMFRIGLDMGVEWFVVEQPAGNEEWESNVSRDLAGARYHVARFGFEARNVGAPYERRRVFILACTSLSRLEVAWSAGPSEIERVARAADARGTWDPRVLRTLPVDARSAGEIGRGVSRKRFEWIEALGDSNPPEMAEVIGGMIARARAAA